MGTDGDTAPPVARGNYELACDWPGVVVPPLSGWAYHLWFARNRQSPRRVRKVTAWEGADFPTGDLLPGGCSVRAFPALGSQPLTPLTLACRYHVLTYGCERGLPAHGIRRGRRPCPGGSPVRPADMPPETSTRCQHGEDRSGRPLRHTGPAARAFLRRMGVGRPHPLARPSPRLRV